MAVNKDVKGFIAIVFLLLGALFGIMVMTFIFGNLGQSTSIIFDPQSATVNNESGGFINSSGYTLSESTTIGFASPVIIFAVNGTGTAEVPSNNFVVSTVGVVTNLTAILWPDVNFTYTFDSDTSQQIIAQSITNNSLEALETYSEQADTQFNTAGIAIVLLILISLFAIFWKFFIGSSTGSSSSGGGIGVMGGGSSGGRRNVASGRGSFG